MASIETITNILTVRIATDMETINNEDIVKFYILALEIARNDYSSNYAGVRSLKVTDSYLDLPHDYVEWFNDGYLMLLLNIKNTLVEGAIYSLTHPDAFHLN